MTALEFKAWFEGLIEALGPGMPTPKQWERIKAMVAGIHATPKNRRSYDFVRSTGATYAKRLNGGEDGG